MKVVTEGRALAAALKAVLTVIERRNMIPILGMARLQLQPGGLVITGTDLDLELRVTIDVIEVDGKPFDMVANARLLYAIMRFAGTAPVTLERVEEEQKSHKTGDKKDVTVTLQHMKITIGDGDQTYRLMQEAKPADFPMLFDPDKPIEIEALEPFTNGHLTELLSSVSVAISTEETRYYLNGIFWQRGVFTATDGHRLVSRRYTATDETEIAEIIPRKTVKVLSQIATPDVATARIKGRHNNLQFVFANMVLTAKTIDGTFPDYGRVIPNRDELSHFFEFDAARLRDAIDRAIAFYSQQRKTALAFVPGPDGDVYVTGDQLYAYEPFIRQETHFEAKTFAKWPASWTEMTTISYTGNGGNGGQIKSPPRFGINMHYLHGFVPKTGTVRLRVKDQGSPILMEIEGEDETTRILMPMRV